MSLPLRAIPADERPREKLLSLGPEKLTDAELLAILLRTGVKGHSVLELAQTLLHHCELNSPRPEDRLGYLLNLDSAELRRMVPGIGPAKLCQVLAALQLGKRVGTQPLERRIDLSNPRAVFDFLSTRMFARTREEFMVILLTAKNHVISVESISEGTLTASLVHPREVFKPAIRRSAHAMILAHNHPSGDPSPSREDREITQRLIQVGKMIGIEVLDHLVIGNGLYYSFREKSGLWSGS